MENSSSNRPEKPGARHQGLVLYAKRLERGIPVRERHGYESDWTLSGSRLASVEKLYPNGLDFAGIELDSLGSS